MARHCDHCKPDLCLFAGGGGGGGSGGGVLVVHDANGTLDKTWKEISTAATSGVVVWVAGDQTDLAVHYLQGTYVEDGEYGVIFMIPADGSVSFMQFTTDNENGYPVVLQNEELPGQ